MNNDIEKLLDLLNSMYPIGTSFREDLKKMLDSKEFRNRKVLFRKGKTATRAYQLLSGFLIGVAINEQGEESIDAIYFPGEIVTDMPSFFKGHLIQLTIRCVGEVKVLELKKENFDKLNIYPETNKLVQDIMMHREQIANVNRTLLKIKSVSNRVANFVTNNPVLRLPAKYASSYLDITESEYIEHSLPHFKSMLFDNEIPTGRLMFKQPNVVAHEVRTYILENYASSEIGTTKNIADKYHVTRKTLSKAFKKLFDLTISQMILCLRMQKAAVLLKKEHMDVNKVGTAVGYNDISSFSRAFKQFYGFSPSKI